MQAIINPTKEIAYTKLPNYYPSMLLEVNTKMNKMSEKGGNILFCCCLFADGAAVFKT